MWGHYMVECLRQLKAQADQRPPVDFLRDGWMLPQEATANLGFCMVAYLRERLGGRIFRHLSVSPLPRMPAKAELLIANALMMPVPDWNGRSWHAYAAEAH